MWFNWSFPSSGSTEPLEQNFIDIAAWVKRRKGLRVTWERARERMMKILAANKALIDQEESLLNRVSTTWLVSVDKHIESVDKWTKLTLSDDIKVNILNPTITQQWWMVLRNKWKLTLWDIKTFIKGLKDDERDSFISWLKLNFPDRDNSRIYSSIDREFQSNSGMMISIGDYLESPSALDVVTYEG